MGYATCPPISGATETAISPSLQNQGRELALAFCRASEGNGHRGGHLHTFDWKSHGSSARQQARILGGRSAQRFDSRNQRTARLDNLEVKI